MSAHQKYQWGEESHAKAEDVELAIAEFCAAHLTDSDCGQVTRGREAYQIEVKARLVSTAEAAGVEPDPAAVMGIAVSLHEAAKTCSGSISEAYSGADGFMRECMRVANLFENWACAHVNFHELDDVWPYMMEDRFAEGAAKVGFSVLALDKLQSDEDCARIAAAVGMKLRGTIHVLPCVLRHKGKLYENVERPKPGERPQFWGIYRSEDGIDTWLADRKTKLDAEAYAAVLRGGGS